ncbi:MAG: type II 3-dehydroquinate dehydratase [Christensenella sp.]|uniref:type II 3-dehydroquinate dehydratase n=1 Tax=Christensenella sp. TaxID=1935934 RepID=UPI002B2149EE|nr:type II 3-dehydroquinate dehydratase [Christensenella sp.]MEA5004671.1 type II 3-dehydroquinate dehydratase [Christensenella sp.]
MKKILIMNGPNLNMLGIREPGVYGNMSLGDMNDFIRAEVEKKNYDVELEFFQSNHEGALIDKLHECYNRKNGIILNAGAYTHYSYAIRDAISSVGIPCVEVHLSDIHAREEFRHVSVVQEVCVAQICGKGVQGYMEALEILMEAQ